MMAIINKIQIHDDKIEVITTIEKMLSILLTPKFNFIVCLIKQCKDINELSID
jgi:hypothetical protein